MEVLSFDELIAKSRWELLDYYESFDDVVELFNVVKKDVERLKQELASNDYKIEQLYNLVKNFSWFVFYSDHTTYPASLEKDIYGRDFFPRFLEIYGKFINDRHGEDESV